MSLFLKKFSTHQEYEQYINGSGAILPNVSICTTEGDVHYNPLEPEPPHDYSQDYFTMVVTSGGDIKWSGSTADNTLSYSKDNGDNWSSVTSADTISVAADDKVLWKGTPTPLSDAFKGIGKFSGDTNARYSVEGNAMSLLFGDDFKGQTNLNGKNYAFDDLFGTNTNVTSAENLSLPATTLTKYCYYRMFQNCTALTTAPELPATTLAMDCYDSMFFGCTSLTTAPSVLPATTLSIYCYNYMFGSCASLTTAPELLATTLADKCYQRMFQRCTNLNSIKCLAADISASDCTYNWVNGVASSGTFTKAASMSSWTTGGSGIPNGWTVVDAQ